MNLFIFSFFFFNDTATTEIYTLSLHDALPISGGPPATRAAHRPGPLPERRHEHRPPPSQAAVEPRAAGCHRHPAAPGRSTSTAVHPYRAWAGDSRSPPHD